MIHYFSSLDGSEENGAGWEVTWAIGSMTFRLWLKQLQQMRLLTVLLYDCHRSMDYSLLLLFSKLQRNSMVSYLHGVYGRSDLKGAYNEEFKHSFLVCSTGGEVMQRPNFLC